MKELLNMRAALLKAHLVASQEQRNSGICQLKQSRILYLIACHSMTSYAHLQNKQALDNRNMCPYL